MTCRVCNEKIISHIESDGSGILEERAYCEKGHYQYEFAYGFAKEIIGTTTIQSAWNDTEEMLRTQEEIVNLAIQLELLHEKKRESNENNYK